MNSNTALTFKAIAKTSYIHLSAKNQKLSAYLSFEKAFSQTTKRTACPLRSSGRALLRVPPPPSEEKGMALSDRAISIMGPLLPWSHPVLALPGQRCSSGGSLSHLNLPCHARHRRWPSLCPPFSQMGPTWPGSKCTQCCAHN